jgi:hypothetical protein
MERVLSVTSFDDERHDAAVLAHWLSRSPEERIAEVERLRREYMVALRGAERHGCPARLFGPLLVVEREVR